VAEAAARADYSIARAALAGAEAERDAYRAALTKVATVELDALETADHIREPTKKGGKRSDKEQL
jgi:outer membrane protein TolC